MEKITFAGVEINRISLGRLFFRKTMLLAYALLAIALFGIYEIFDLRYFSLVTNAHDAGLNPTDPAIKEAMKQAIFGTVGEIDKTQPWTILIANYMYMIYTGSGVMASGAMLMRCLPQASRADQALRRARRRGN